MWRWLWCCCWVCAIVVDEGYWFYRKAEMQRATDAATMAGAGALISGDQSTAVARSRSQALKYAQINGFAEADPKVKVALHNNVAEKTFSVTITRPEPTFFGSVFGTRAVNLVTTAVASYNRPTRVLIPVTGGNYGLNNGPINLGIYGPDQITNRGDLYSARYTTDTQGLIVPNPDYRPEGYSFAITLSPQFGSNTATLQLYDADSFDSGADLTADDKVWDEGTHVRYGPNGSGYGALGAGNLTVTRYTLYADSGTPFDPSDDTLINSLDVGNDQNYDRQWKDAFTWRVDTYRNARPNVNFRMAAQTISGSTENGFNVRVVRPGETDATFENGGGNGSSVSAIGDIPVNFGKNGLGEVSLGYVPAGATQVRIDHFDSDVGVTAGTQIEYLYENNGVTSQTYPGNSLLGAAADNVTETDTIDLSGYTGGFWKAIYNAGGSDNTTWRLSYDGPPTDTPGSIRLIR